MDGARTVAVPQSASAFWDGDAAFFAAYPNGFLSGWASWRPAACGHRAGAAQHLWEKQGWC